MSHAHPHNPRTQTPVLNRPQMPQPGANGPQTFVGLIQQQLANNAGNLPNNQPGRLRLELAGDPLPVRPGQPYPLGLCTPDAKKNSAYALMCTGTAATVTGLFAWNFPTAIIGSVLQAAGAGLYLSAKVEGRYEDAANNVARRNPGQRYINNAARVPGTMR